MKHLLNSRDKSALDKLLVEASESNNSSRSSDSASNSSNADTKNSANTPKINPEASSSKKII